MASRRRLRGTNAAGVFGIGDEVEVSCDEEGFVGAWYEAMVVRRLARHRRYSVVYASILSDNDPSRALQEVVRASHVRPRPPRADGEPIGVHELVEGFHRDGWWPGVVSELREKRYLVSFPATREEIEFPAAKVRRRLRWVKGRWVSPEDEEGPEIMFGVGSEVEVTRDKEAYGAVWYPGTVTKVIGKAYCLVEYKILRPNMSGCNGGGGPWREIVDPQYIRPSPPDSACERNFYLHDEVEALYVGKWLVGVISKVLMGSRYVVKLEHKDEELEFDQSMLRFRHDWIDGRWTRVFMDRHRKSAIAHRTNSICEWESEAGKESPVIVSVSKSNPCGNQTANEPDSDNMFPECDGATVRQKLQVRRRCNFPDSVSKDTKNSEKDPEEKTLEEPISIFLTPKRKKRDGQSLEGQSKSPHYLKKSKQEEQCHSESHYKEKRAVNPPLEGQSKSTESPRKSNKEHHPFHSHPYKEESTVSSQVEGQSKSPESQKKSKREEHHPSESLSKEKNPASPEVGSKSSPNVSSGHSYEVLMHKLQRLTKILIDGSKLEEKENKSKKLNLNLLPPNEGTSDVLTAEPKKLGSAHGSTLSNKTQRKRVVIRVPNQRKMTLGLDERQLQKEETRVGKRGRPSKKNIIHANPALQCIDTKKLETVADLVVEREETMKEVKSQALNCAGDLSHEIESPCLGNASLKHEYSTPKADIIGNVSIDRINRRLKILDSWNLSNHAEPMRPQSNCLMEGDGVSNLPLKKPLANPPLQCSFSGAIIQAPCQEDGVIVHQEPMSNCSASELRIVEADGASMKLSDGNSSENKSIMSSVKKSPMWKSIESMEAFQMMPQQPHFHPLELYCEELRDGMAIGFMVAFANLITNIRTLRIDDPKEDFESRLRALIPLEENGFDVGCLRSRIEQLLEIKTNRSQCKFQKVRLEGQILDRNNENIRIDVALAELDKAIVEVEKSLAHFREKKDSIIIQRKANEVEIERMQMDLQAAEEAYVLADSNFRFALTTPL